MIKNHRDPSHLIYSMPTQEMIHTALDLRKGKKGNHTLQVTVTDLNSEVEASRQTSFVLL